MLPVNCHLSCVVCHLSIVTSQLSPVTCHLGDLGGFISRLTANSALSPNWQQIWFCLLIYRLFLWINSQFGSFSEFNIRCQIFTINRHCDTFLAPFDTFMAPCHTFLVPCDTFPLPYGTFLAPCDTFLAPSDSFLAAFKKNQLSMYVMFSCRLFYLASQSPSHVTWWNLMTTKKFSKRSKFIQWILGGLSRYHIIFLC